MAQALAEPPAPVAERCVATQRTIALIPWGNVIEDFLDPIGLALGEFCQRMTGGWLFGYAEALNRAGWRPILFCFSRDVQCEKRLRHQPSGMVVCVLPAWRWYKRIAHHMKNPYGWSVDDAFGPVSGLRRILCHSLKELAPYLATPLGALTAGLRRERCAAILTQEYEYARFDLCSLLGRMLGIPVFATFQGGDRHVGRLESWVRPVTMRAASGFIAATTEEARRIAQTYAVPSRKIWHIHNPLDLDLWYSTDGASTRQALGIPPGSAVVVYHGRIDMYRKGIDVLLDAWELLSTKHSQRDMRLLMIGSGADADALRERLARPQLARVIWVDRYELDRAVMRRYLGASDISVLPSRLEGFPVAPLEAMACGLPVVASGIDAMRAIMDHDAKFGELLVPPGDAHALAAALERLIDQPALARDMGRRARRIVEDKFSLDVVAKQLAGMLSQDTSRESADA